MKQSLIVFGTGSLAKSMLYSLPFFYKDELDVFIVGRNSEVLSRTTTIANSRSTFCRSKVRYYEELLDLTEDDKLTQLIKVKSAEYIMLAASLQSPWELAPDSSTWANLVAEAGFGFTLPLQATFAIKIAKAIKKSGCNIKFINGCYPDQVNPLLKLMDLPITIGVGNVAILSSYLSSKLNILPDELKMIGHHFMVC